jgi:hypothetical protein
MATTWGGWSGHMRVGIDAYTSAIVSGTTSVTMTIDFWIQIDSTWNFGDAQTLNIGGPGATSVNFTNNLGPNQTLKLRPLRSQVRRFHMVAVRAGRGVARSVVTTRVLRLLIRVRIRFRLVFLRFRTSLG